MATKLALSGLKAFADWLIKPAITGIVGALALGVMAPWIFTVGSRLNPTCTDHRGLRAINVAEAIVDGAATLTATNSAEVTNSLYEPDRYQPERVFDRRISSVWAEPVDPVTSPRMDEDDPAPLNDVLEAAVKRTSPVATLHVEFAEPLDDVRLICVVNGIPLDPDSYRRADRVDQATLEVSCTPRSSPAMLRSMAAHEIAVAQRLPSSCRTISTLEFSILSTHPGSYIVDPALQVPMAPTNLVAVAEIILYEPVRHGEPDHSQAAAYADWVVQHPARSALTALGALALTAALFLIVRRVVGGNPGPSPTPGSP